MFDDEPQAFTILPHGNNKSENSISFKRTQESTIESIKNRLIFEDTRKELFHVELDHILTCQSSGILAKKCYTVLLFKE